jgi:hypothetical protein
VPAHTELKIRGPKLARGLLIVGANGPLSLK